MPSSYEKHIHPYPQFPVIFHSSLLEEVQETGYLHWHEDIELLYCTEGSGVVISDTARIFLHAGDIAVVNSNCLHSVYSEGRCRYHCLIPDNSLFRELDLPVGEAPLRQLVQDDEARRWFDLIVKEMEEKRTHYQSAVRVAILNLFLLLFRYHRAMAEEAPIRQNNRLEMVKSAIAYIRRAYTWDITVDDICRHVGFSKYYVCHAFKEITGQTIVSYINFLRCNHARSLLAMGRFNIGQCAEQSGFHNLSYFSKTYKKQMGVLPSIENRKAPTKELELPPDC